MPLVTDELGETIIGTETLSKSFGSYQVLDAIELSVSSGEIVCIVGPSGSGKTTLLRCLALLESPTTGRVLVNGRVASKPDMDNVAREHAKTVRADIGMVFQQFNLWPHMTVMENVIEAPIRVRRTRRQDAIAHADHLLCKVGLQDKRNSYPGRLSGGQQQRVAIARALAMTPRILLFDEPTSALDPELRREVLTVMRELASERMTMVVVTHEMAFARRAATRIIFMDKGTVIEDSDPTAFFSAARTDRARQFLAQLED